MTFSKCAALLLALALSLGACGDDEMDLESSTTTSTAAETADSPVDPASPAAEPGASPADRAAKSELRNAITAAKTLATDSEGRFEKPGTGEPIDAAALAAENPSGQYGPSGSASADVVSVLVRDVSGPNSDIWLVTASTAGTFFCIHGDTAGSITFGHAGSEAEAVVACTEEAWPGD